MGNAWSRESYRVHFPDHLVSRRKYIRDILENCIKGWYNTIERKDAIVVGINRLSIRGHLQQVLRKCEEHRLEYEKELSDYIPLEIRWTAEEYYRCEIYDSLAEQLNIIVWEILDEDTRRNALAPVFLYFLMGTKEPNKACQKILFLLHDPLYNHTGRWYNFSWYEWCCVILRDEFDYLCKLIESIPICHPKFVDSRHLQLHLELLLYKRPQLLLNKQSGGLMNKLIGYMPTWILRWIISNIRDEKGQTCMFFTRSYDLDAYVKLYGNYTDDLITLLSIPNTSGQTALHVNTLWITELLAHTYMPRHRDALTTLTSITDNKNKTALKVADEEGCDRLSALLERVEKNEYITWALGNTTVLIIYNTTNRTLRAQKEALAIYNACAPIYNGVSLQKDKTKDEIIYLIQQAAARRNWRGLPATSLIVILASHGNIGTIDDCKSTPIELSEIEEAMCSTVTLNGKPKILITQCCQIGEESEELHPYVPTHDDFCAVMSCRSGQRSERGIFLTKLSKQIKKSQSDTNIFRIVTEVCRQMKLKKKEQTPIIMSTLKAEFCPTDQWYSKK